MSRILMKGNEAIGEGAVRAGCRYFFGYPITPQSELTHYLARRLPEVGACTCRPRASSFHQYGLRRFRGGRKGYDLLLGARHQPDAGGLSFLAGAELPCVVVNMMRGGPGLGNIAPSQADYFQATKGGGHGDYRLIVLAPNSVQEILDLTGKAFELADYYRNPVMVMADGIMAQMMEPVELKNEAQAEIQAKPWAASGMIDHPGSKRIINSCFVIPEEMEAVNIRLKEKYTQILFNEQDSEGYLLEDAEIVLVAFGTVSRICRAVVERPGSWEFLQVCSDLSPVAFPAEELKRTTGKAKCFIRGDEHGSNGGGHPAGHKRKSGLPLRSPGRNGPGCRDVLRRFKNCTAGVLLNEKGL